MEHRRVGPVFLASFLGLLSGCGGVDVDEAVAHMKEALIDLTYTLTDTDGEFEESILDVRFDEASGVLVLTIASDFQPFNMDIPVREVSVYYGEPEIEIESTDGRVVHRLLLLCDARAACIESGDPIERALLSDEETHSADGVVYCLADECGTLVRDLQALGAKVATEPPRFEQPGTGDGDDSQVLDEPGDPDGGCPEGAVAVVKGTIGRIAPEGDSAFITPEDPIIAGCGTIRTIRIEGSHPQCIVGAQFDAFGAVLRWEDSAPTFFAGSITCETPGEPAPTARVLPSRTGSATARLVQRINAGIDRSTWFADGMSVTRAIEVTDDGQLALHGHRCELTPSSDVELIEACRRDTPTGPDTTVLFAPTDVDGSSIRLESAQGRFAVTFLCRERATCVARPDGARTFPGGFLACPDATQCNRLVIDFASLLDLAAQQNPRTR